MRSLKLFTFALALTAVFTLAAAAQTKSLYERLGGKESIVAVVDDFAGRVLADTRINAKFAKSDPVRLKTMLVDQICAATGGPCQYTGRSMPASHANMGVTAGEFNALVEDLVASLDKFNVPAAEKNELLGALAPMKAQIVEVESDATGTPLPKKFKPYSADAAMKGKGKKAKEPKPSKEEKKMMKEEKKAKEETATEENKEMSGKKSKKKYTFGRVGLTIAS